MLLSGRHHHFVLHPTLARFVELGYLKEATLLPDGESYLLVKGSGYHFPAKRTAAISDHGGKTPRKAYRRKRAKPDLPGGGDK